MEDKDILAEDTLNENIHIEAEESSRQEGNELDNNEINDSETAEYEAEDCEECSEQEGSDDKQSEHKKSSFFKKDKKEKKDKKDEKIEELNDRLMRNMAEFDNFRKRSEKEKSQMFDMGAKGIIEKVLPVIDNFERGLSVLTEEEKSSAFAQGIEKIYKQLITTLSEAGLSQIEAVGKEFDPNFHNAVMHTEDSEMDQNIVAEEFLKGYMYKESVVRHSMVKVVN